MLPHLTSPRSRAWWVWAAVLPALALRVLVPAGLMPMRDTQGRLSLMLCPGEWPAALTASPDAHAHHHHHDTGSGDTPGSAPDSDRHGAVGAHTLCPFALSAGPALAGAILVQSLPPARVDYLPRAPYPDPLLEPLRRVQTARAPPLPHQA